MISSWAMSNLAGIPETLPFLEILGPGLHKFNESIFLFIPTHDDKTAVFAFQSMNPLSLL